MARWALAVGEGGAAARCRSPGQGAESLTECPWPSHFLPSLPHMILSSERWGSHLQALKAPLGGSSCPELVFLHTAVEPTEGAGPRPPSLLPPCRAQRPPPSPRVHPVTWPLHLRLQILEA